MRYQGKIASWDIAKGFGFIDWNGGNDRVFLHVSAIENRTRQPAVGDVVTYEVARDEQGRFKATKVAFARSSVPSAVPRRRPGFPWTRIAMLAALLLAGIGLLQRHQADAEKQSPSPDEVPLQQISGSAPLAAEDAVFRCDGRTHCSQMTSCQEATFYLKNCPGTEMDGDGDRVPCESQWCQ